MERTKNKLLKVQGANGYLFDTFVHSNINDRTDEYGGSLQNRLRFPLKVLDAISAAIGAERTAIRIAPFYNLKHVNDVNRLETFSAYCAALDSRGLAYVHLIEPRYDQIVSGTVFDAQRISTTNAKLPSTSTKKAEDTLWPFRKILKRMILIGAGGYSAESAREALLEGKLRTSTHSTSQFMLCYL